MTETVWRYPLNRGPGVVHEFTMPKGATFVSAGLRGNQLCVWARVDPHAEPEVRNLIAIGTGHFADVPLGRFVGRIAEPSTPLTSGLGFHFQWHVFEVEE